MCNTVFKVIKEVFDPLQKNERIKFIDYAIFLANVLK